MKAYIIHLERATERREQVEKIRAALPMPVETVAAVDGAALSPQEFNARYRRSLHAPHYPFDLRPGEIGCFLSHRKCWELIAASGDDGALIVEDDVRIDVAGLMKLMAIVTQYSSLNAYVRFPAKAGREQGKTLFENDGMRLFAPATPGHGTVCQYVGRQVAVSLLAATEEFDRPVDTFLQMRFHHGLDILSTAPVVIEEISAEIGSSMIQASTKSIGERLYREFARFRYRREVRNRNHRSPGLRLGV